MAEKSILEQALLRVNTLEEAVKQNAKGILTSVMKEELNELLKESKEEEDEAATEPEEMMGMDEVSSEEAEQDMSEEPDNESQETQEQADDESDDESDESDDESSDSLDMDDLDNDEGLEDKDIDSMDSDMEEPEMEEPGMEEPVVGDEDVLDMTGASDDEVVKVFKKMKPEDQVVVKKDGDDIELEVDDDQFIIKLDEEESKEEATESMEETDESEMESDEETVYEIELSEDNEEEQNEEWKEEATEARQGALKGLGNAVKKEPKEGEKVEATEAARTKSNAHGNKGGANRLGIKGKKKYRAGVPPALVSEELQTLKKQNSEYKKALVLFKEKLNEVAIFNANLAYATRLFTEHSTTKKEKLDILKRFDSISSLNESRNLYNTIKTELDTKKPVTESVVEKISTTPTTSASSEVLSESKAYENPQFRRMKDLMAKIK